MGWAFGVNNAGREIGYGVEAICDHNGCEEKIDRGLAYFCGGPGFDEEAGCGFYFCPKHLHYAAGHQLCQQCVDTYPRCDVCHGSLEDGVCPDRCDEDR